MPVPGATWQAGVTPGSYGWRVTVDGEPCPMAYAALPGPKGWAKVYVAEAPRRNGQGGEGMATTEYVGGRDTVYGVVRLVRGDADYATS